MEFVLIYNGELKTRSRVGSKHKHAIRKTLHTQLSELWNQQPLSGIKDNLFQHGSIIKKVGDFSFIPLVGEETHLVCELDILMLRPGELMGIIENKSGDIDNRLKTLFDALRCPHTIDEIPKDEKSDETPMFCLLEDDKFITSVKVTTERLLQSEKSKNYVFLMIKVKLKKFGETRWFHFNL